MGGRRSSRDATKLATYGQLRNILRRGVDSNANRVGRELHGSSRIVRRSTDLAHPQYARGAPVRKVLHIYYIAIADRDDSSESDCLPLGLHAVLWIRDHMMSAWRRRPDP